MGYYQQGEEQAKLAIANAGMYIPPTDRQKLEQKRQMLESELMRVEKALNMLDKHPELEEFSKVLAEGLR